MDRSKAKKAQMLIQDKYLTCLGNFYSKDTYLKKCCAWINVLGIKIEIER